MNTSVFNLVPAELYLAPVRGLKTKNYLPQPQKKQYCERRYKPFRSVENLYVFIWNPSVCVRLDIRESTGVCRTRSLTWDKIIHHTTTELTIAQEAGHNARGFQICCWSCSGGSMRLSGQLVGLLPDQVWGSTCVDLCNLHQDSSPASRERGRTERWHKEH